MFLLGLSNEEIEDYFNQSNYKKLSEHLYRVQKISTKNYVFRHHLETQLDDSENAQISKKFYLIQSIKSLFNLTPQKVKIDILGNISLK